MNPELTLDFVITPRGVGIASAGIVLGALGVGYASPVLAYLGVTLVVAVVLGAVWMLLSVNTFIQRFPFARREVRPRPLTVGQPGTVTVKILAGRAAGAMAMRLRRPFSALLDIREQAAAELTGGMGTKATVARTPDSITLTYNVQPAKRGRWPLGPALVHTSDPMGTFWADTAMGESELIPVWPAIVDLSAAAGALMGQADRVVIGARTPSPDDASLRDYHEGDDLRRVHWPSTARRGSMVVRSDERAGRRPATILLDLPRESHALERAISTAASIGVSVLESGHPVRLLGSGLADHATHHIGGRGAYASKAELLDLTVDLTAPISKEAASAQMVGAASQLSLELHHGEVIISVMEPATSDVLEALIPLGESGRSWAIVRHDERHDATDTVSALQRAGWRAARYRSTDDLAALWTTMISSGNIE